MSDDYTPTTEEVEGRYISTRSARFSRKGFRRWLAETLAARDAEKRAEWEAEQGEPEWEYGIQILGEVRIRGPLDEALRSAEIWGDDEYPALIVRRRKAGPWLPVPDTTNHESEG